MSVNLATVGCGSGGVTDLMVLTICLSEAMLKFFNPSLAFIISVAKQNESLSVCLLRLRMQVWHFARPLVTSQSNCVLVTHVCEEVPHNLCSDF